MTLGVTLSGRAMGRGASSVAGPPGPEALAHRLLDTLVAAAVRVESAGASGKGVARDQIGETAEVAVGGPDLRDAVGAADGSDASVVHPWTGDTAALQELPQHRPVAGALIEQGQGWRFEPCLHLVDSGGHRSRGVVDPGMGDDREELVDARPGYGPRRTALGEAADRGRRPAVPLGVCAMGVDQ